MDAILYTTNTGSTEHYARLLAEQTKLPVYSLAEAKKRFRPEPKSFTLVGSWRALLKAIPMQQSAIR